MANEDHKKRVEAAMGRFFAKQNEQTLKEAQEAEKRPRIKIKRHHGDNPPEWKEQRILANFLDRLPVVWCHVANERNTSPVKGYALKASGVKSGVPDVLCFTPSPKHFKPVAIELKRKKGGRVTENQKQWLEDLEKCGWSARVCKGADEAIEFLRELGFHNEGRKI